VTALLIHTGVVTVSLTHDDLDIVNTHAKAVEEAMADGPVSGLDNTISTFGGAFVYEKVGGTRRRIGLELEVVIINTTIPKNTGIQGTCVVMCFINA
jgi:mevalonate kinase